MIPIEEVPLSRTRENPRNPRKYFDPDRMAELTKSVRDRGVKQAILLRPVPMDGDGRDLEVVYGHRRRRAAIGAELATIPAQIEAMTDQQALEEQLVENRQREDVHPLEEADAFREAHDAYGLSIQEIADKVAKSTSYVYQRLKYSTLCDDGRQAFLEHKLNPTTALIVARIPDPGLQAKALAKILTPTSWRPEPLTAREASELVQRDFMLRLEGVPWDLTDAKLVPAAGACSTCPKRTGAQPELFSDVPSRDVCTDPPCFKEKQEALWQIRVAEAKAEKRSVLSAKETKVLFPYNNQLAYNAPYVDLKATCSEDPKGRTYEQLLKKVTVPTALVRDPSGATHDLIEKKQLKKLLKDAGHEFKREAPARGNESKKEKQEQASRELRRKVGELARARLGALIEKGAWEKLEVWLWVAIRQAQFTGDGEAVLESRGLKKTDELKGYCKTLPQALAVLLETSLDCDLGGYTKYSDELVELSALLGLDLAQLEAELQPKPPAPAEKSKGAPLSYTFAPGVELTPTPATKPKKGGSRAR